MTESGLTGLQIFGIALLIYGIISLIIGLFKPKKLWQTAKIQAFVRLIGNTGTVIMMLLLGAVTGGIGIYLLVG